MVISAVPRYAGFVFNAPEEDQPWEVDGSKQSMKAVSPPFLQRSESLAAILNVCKSLKANLPVTFRLSDVLRVQVLGDSNLSDTLMQRIAAFIWNFESVLQQLYPHTSWYQSHRYGHRQYLRKFTTLAKVIEKRKREHNAPVSPQKLITAILDYVPAENVAKVLTHFDYWESQSYAFLISKTLNEYHYHMRWYLHHMRWPNSFPAVVFQIHEGTLEIDRIWNRIQVCVGLVTFLHDCEFSSFAGFLVDHIDSKDYSPQRLLNDIGRENLIEFYQQQFDEHQSIASGTGGGLRTCCMQ